LSGSWQQAAQLRRPAQAPGRHAWTASPWVTAPAMVSTSSSPARLADGRHRGPPTWSAGQGHRRQAAALASAPKADQYPEQASDDVTAVTTGARHAEAAPWPRVVGRFGFFAPSASNCFNAARARCSRPAARLISLSLVAASNSASASASSFFEAPAFVHVGEDSTARAARRVPGTITGACHHGFERRLASPVCRGSRSIHARPGASPKRSAVMPEPTPSTPPCSPASRRCSSRRCSSPDPLRSSARLSTP
jgi:hypothetical protein